MEVHAELLGADITEHSVKHGNVNVNKTNLISNPNLIFPGFQVGVSRAISVLGPVLDSDDVRRIDNIGVNPMHEKNINLVKNLARKKRYKFSRILRDITRNRNLGINLAQNLFPKKAKKKSAPKPQTNVSQEQESAPPQMAWVN